MKWKTLVIAGAVGLGVGVVAAPAAHADGCTRSGWGSSCDFNYTADGSHEHCDEVFNVPFVGHTRNCFWVSTTP